MPSPQAEPNLLQLHRDDNVLTVATPIGAGQTFRIEDRRFTAKQAIAVGFKIAAREIPAGTKVIKYGAPIGTASGDIAAGDVVHTHNLKSDYLPTYLRGEGEAKTP